MTWMNSATVRASVVAAAAATGVAIAGLISGAVTAYFQQKSESEHLQSSILLEVVKADDSKKRTDYATRLLEAGVLKDDNGAICRALVQQGCPIKVLSSN
jgi:hypothetical protein